jgi:hypothetical protein
MSFCISFIALVEVLSPPPTSAPFSSLTVPALLVACLVLTQSAKAAAVCVIATILNLLPVAASASPPTTDPLLFPFR